MFSLTLACQKLQIAMSNKENGAPVGGIVGADGNINYDHEDYDENVDENDPEVAQINAIAASSSSSSSGMNSGFISSTGLDSSQRRSSSSSEKKTANSSTIA